MGLAFSRIEIETAEGPRAALVVEPDGDVPIRRDRLEKMRRGNLESTADDTIVRAASEMGKIDAVVFRARGASEEDRWHFSDELLQQEVTELAALFIRAHLALFRQLSDAGVSTLVGVEFGEREADAYLVALDRLADELQRELADCDDPARQSELRLGLWFAERQANWSRAAFDEFVPEGLAERILQSERQLVRLRVQGGHVANV